MTWRIFIIIIFFAVFPLSLINAIANKIPISFNPTFIGESIGGSIAYIVSGAIIGSLIWLPTRYFLQEKTPSIQSFIAVSTVVLCMLLAIGNAGCLIQPQKC
jgi:uncharacterized membrane protein YdjX (TVP38/TMEM64 family)